MDITTRSLLRTRRKLNACTDRVRRNSLKLCQGRFRLDIRTKFAHPGGGWALERLPREVVTVPRLTGFKKILGNTLRYMVWFL